MKYFVAAAGEPDIPVVGEVESGGTSALVGVGKLFRPIPKNKSGRIFESFECNGIPESMRQIDWSCVFARERVVDKKDKGSRDNG